MDAVRRGCFAETGVVLITTLWLLCEESMCVVFFFLCFFLGGEGGEMIISV